MRRKIDVNDLFVRSNWRGLRRTLPILFSTGLSDQRVTEICHVNLPDLPIMKILQREMSLSVVNAYLALDHSTIVQIFNSIQLSECINQTILVSFLKRFFSNNERNLDFFDTVSL